MDEASVVDANAPSDELRATVGAVLAQARVAAGLSVEDLAARLNLRSSFIAAVEEGRGDTHMEWSYERNHIRSIAALLSIDLPEGFQEASP